MFGGQSSILLVMKTQIIELHVVQSPLGYRKNNNTCISTNKEASGKQVCSFANKQCFHRQRQAASGCNTDSVLPEVVFISRSEFFGLLFSSDLETKLLLVCSEFDTGFAINVIFMA